MKQLFLSILFSVSALAGIGVQYDPNSAGVANRVSSILPSVDTVEYALRPNCVVLLAWSDVLTNQVTDIKWNGNAVVLLTQGEKDAITAAQAAAAVVNSQFVERVAKTNALSTVNRLDLDGRLLTALAEIMRDEINILRSQMDLDRVNETGFRAATNRTAVPLAPRTMLQLKNAITTKITEQADNN